MKEKTAKLHCMNSCKPLYIQTHRKEIEMTSNSIGECISNDSSNALLSKIYFLESLNLQKIKQRNGQTVWTDKNGKSKMCNKQTKGYSVFLVTMNKNNDLAHFKSSEDPTSFKKVESLTYCLQKYS